MAGINSQDAETLTLDCPPDDSSCADARPTRTDSGITHTVPNHSIVTVTRHTVIFSAAPTTTTTDTTLAPATTTDGESLVPFSTLPLTDAAASSTETSGKGVGVGDGGASVSSGVVVGIAVAGCVVVGAVLLGLFFVLGRRRRRRRRREDADAAAAYDHGLGGTDEKEEQPMSAHTTGTQASGADPFAPFGGRADQTPEVALEMDGASMAPVELPAEPTKSVRPVTPNHDYQPRPVPPAADPRANLNSNKTDSGHGAYVNHWSNWRALGSAGDEGL
ncbi:hypothetical protein CP533_6634 [Ophiocordyceps camponoti-saundersi (nom. inval.)]|nr:hypothetical protein CP533_6634 [Ophiocordyceps camponoti-saundersi (nom. inval.)]